MPKRLLLSRILDLSKEEWGEDVHKAIELRAVSEEGRLST